MNLSSTELFPEELRAHFEPLALVGKGAMGAVFRCHDRRLERTVAVKLHFLDAQGPPRIRFRREAEGLARILHPNVVRVFDHGEANGVPYLVMELLEGVALERPPEGTRPLEVMLQVAEGLDAVHAEGLVHRDLKPANVLLTEDGRAVLVDFGLVHDPDRTRLTRTGHWVGTPSFLPPETFTGAPPGPAGDWYAWGCLLYRLCEGRPPYPATALMARRPGDPLPPPTFRRLEPEGEVAALLRRTLSADPALRPRSSAEVRALLKEPGRDLDGEVEVVTVEAPVPPVSGRPGRSPRLLPYLAPALAVGVLVLAWRPWIPPGGPEPSGASRAAEGPGRPSTRAPAPLEGLAARTREGLEADAGRWLDRWGARAPAPGTGDAGGGELFPVLDTDPARGGFPWRTNPGLSAFREWRGGGGDPALLTGERQLELAEVDGLFAARGLRPPPFAPFLDLQPAPAPVDPPPLLREPEYRELGFPARPRGWLATMLASLQAADRVRHDLDRDLARGRETGAVPEGFPWTVWAARERFLHPDAWSLVRATSAEAEHRRALRGWLAPGVAALLRAWVAAARSVELEPETREQAALAPTVPTPRYSVFYYSTFAFTPPEVILGAPPTCPAGWYLRSRLLFVQRTVATRVGLDVPASLVAEERRALELALADLETARAPAARLRHGQALYALLDHHRQRGDAEAVQRLVSRSARHLEELPPETRAHFARLAQELTTSAGP